MAVLKFDEKVKSGRFIDLTFLWYNRNLESYIKMMCKPEYNFKIVFVRSNNREYYNGVDFGEHGYYMFDANMDNWYFPSHFNLNINPIVFK